VPLSHERTAPKALLVSLREPHDPMTAHERACFADVARLPLDHLSVHFMTDGPLPGGSLGRYDAVFFGGSGAYSVLDDIPWIREGLVALQRVVDARRPAWASCFGFQGLARALGGEVVHDEARSELGATLLHLTEAGRVDPLLGALPAQFWAQEGHHDRVTVLPPGVHRLATGDLCPEQAFRVDGAPFWASQFHPELTAHSTLARFEHYRAHYFDGPPEAFDAVAARLAAGVDSPEVSELLARLVRGEYGG
jgi:GMP synthase (glutamine-hydrolysing)